MDPTKFFYVYNYTDHLGNVRMSYTDNGTAVPKILEENHYYPFGLKHENYASEKFNIVKEPNGDLYVIQPTERREWQYKYNGKEWQDELGLNFYDYGARNYDAAIGRWMNVDPLAEKYHSFSGYGYCLSSPLIYIDPTGMEVELIDGGIRFTGADAQSAFSILIGKKRNVFVSVEEDEKRRREVAMPDKDFGYGNWAGFGVKDLAVARAVLNIFDDNFLNNLIVMNHGGSRGSESYFEFGTTAIALDSQNSITGSEIAANNEQKANGTDMTAGVKEAGIFADIAKKVKSGGNFILAFCYTGEGQAGQNALKALTDATGNRLNVFLPTQYVKGSYKIYDTGAAFNLNRKLEFNGGWIYTSPGVKDAKKAQSIILSTNAKPVTVKK